MPEEKSVPAKEYDNPYWNEIVARLDEVTDGLSISVGLPPRREMKTRGLTLEQMAVNPFRDVDPITTMERYRTSLYHRRKDFCAKYCWAIPDPATLDFLTQWCGPSVVEMGSGTGYFAWMLSQRGIRVHAYDIAPPHLHTDNEYHSPRNEQHVLTGETREVYYPVEVGTPETLVQHADSTLFLCWPPMSDMARECLKYYAGNRLVYIGEGDGGCNADEEFFTRLSDDWDEVASHKIIQWDAIHDYVEVYERKKVRTHEPR